MPTSLTELFSPACHLCPRRCGAARDEGARGVCGANDTLKVARAALHMWEEPPISGEAGSGTIFFSGCSLKCIYCQNHEISTGNFGLEISPERLVEIMLELQEQGANNINLVTATHYAHLLPAAIAAARTRGLVIPIVYNTSGYERASAVAALGDLVDVWLTDFKYADAGLAQSLSHIKDYPRVAVSGLAQMAREIERRGGELVDEDGLMKRGMIVRHLVLPGHADDSCRVLDLVWQTVGDVPISVMNQYTPNALMREQGGDLGARRDARGVRAGARPCRRPGLYDDVLARRRRGRRELHPGLRHHRCSYQRKVVRSSMIFLGRGINNHRVARAFEK